MSDRRKCPTCGREVGTYSTGRLRPHYAPGSSATCAGSFIPRHKLGAA